MTTPHLYLVAYCFYSDTAAMDRPRIQLLAVHNPSGRYAGNPVRYLVLRKLKKNPYHTQTILRNTGIPSYTSICSCIVLVAQGDAVGAGNNSSLSVGLRSRGKKRFAYKVCIHCMHYWLWDYGREAKQDMHTRYPFAYKVCVCIQGHAFA